MADAETLVAEIRSQLQPVRDRLMAHPYVAAVESGRLPRVELHRFAGEQHAIISSDLRSVAHLVARQGGEFFLGILDGERAALAALDAFGSAIGMTGADLQTYEPTPGAHAYACYMAWLAAYASAAEVAAAYLVNFEAWGSNCGRMSRALQARYGLGSQEVSFFDLFAAPDADFEAGALAVIEGGLGRGVAPVAIHRAARLLQGYEKLFWDTLQTLSRR